MEKEMTFENFPLWMVLTANAVSLGIYLAGAYIMFLFGAFWGWLYLLCCLAAEIRVMLFSCRYCYYLGKWCGMGKGKLAALFLNKGDPVKFVEKQITWKDLIPDLLVSLIPFLLGIYILFTAFSWSIIAIILILLVLTTMGNGFVRGNLSCKHCKQREIGCPAEKLFAKDAK